MENFPSNAKKPLREDRELPSSAMKEPKKVERIVEGEVIRRKKPLGKRFTETFLGGDAKGVWAFVLMDVLVPAAKDAAADAVSQGIERMIYGEARSASRRTGHRPGGGGLGHIRYDRPSGPGATFKREERAAPSRRARATFDFGEIILATRVEAEEVIDKLFEIVSKYDAVKVSDLYELLGITATYTEERYGWTDLRGAGVERVRSGYLLDLPRPELLD